MGPVLHIAGEALNQSTDIVSGVKVIATLYDSNNKIVGTGSSYLSISNNLCTITPYDLIFQKFVHLD